MEGGVSSFHSGVFFNCGFERIGKDDEELRENCGELFFRASPRVRAFTAGTPRPAFCPRLRRARAPVCLLFGPSAWAR